MEQNSKEIYFRFKSRPINIGSIPLGGKYPIRVQSMTNTDTLDIDRTVEQSIKLINEGCEYVRITTPSIKEAEALIDIKNKLNKNGYQTPIIADVHYNPKVAEFLAPQIEKVRINPGNYADKKSFRKFDFNDYEYNDEIERIRKRFFPLVKICKEYGTAMRIGSNHGSLSDRIMSRFGDTPEGMVESALEFIRICEEQKYFNIVVSMKASNPIVMVNAYRLMLEKMIHEKMNYPLHLGVTEAGNGEDGIIKSAVGIGTLLEEGIGDTIRVSLSDSPEKEIPIAKTIANRYNQRFQTNGGFFNGYSSKNINQRTSVSIDFPIIINNNKNFDFEKSSVMVVDSEKEEKVKSIENKISEKIKSPIIAKLIYKGISKDEFQIYSAIDFGSLLLNNYIDGLWVMMEENITDDFVEKTLVNILQSTRKKISKTEYISCPTCGRTTYNLLETLMKVKEKTSHLKGLKIAVMGCVVNGLGEMADADYGYIGTANGKVNLYKQKQLMKKNIIPEIAVDHLIELIKENGDWKNILND